MNRPNILYIVTDQQHFGMMSCAGNRYVSTPAMDSLAAEGVRFDRAYCTNPVCAASRFSLFTGRMPSDIGLWSNYPYWIPNCSQEVKANSLGNRMREAGYDAMYGGKFHLPGMVTEESGFDHFCKDERDGLARQCADFLSAKRNEPFCLVASFINPHDICGMAIREAIDSPAEREAFDSGVLMEGGTLDRAIRRPAGVDEEEFFEKHCPPLPPNFEPQADEPEALRYLLEIRSFRMRARRLWSERRWREHRWAYARLTEEVDRQIGTILSALRQGPHADNTLIAFTSDHGDMDGSQRMEHKSLIYDESARIPLILCPPGSARSPRAGRVDRRHLVSNGLDLVPTFYDYAGIDLAPSLCGRSLRPLVEAGRSDSWRAVVPIETGVGRAIVTDRFKYARYDFGENAEQLIDLRADPHERRNAVADSHLAGELAGLRGHFDSTFSSAPRPPEEDRKKVAEFA